jgi:hypothetical protein
MCTSVPIGYSLLQLRSLNPAKAYTFEMPGASLAVPSALPNLEIICRDLFDMSLAGKDKLLLVAWSNLNAVQILFYLERA